MSVIRAVRYHDFSAGHRVCGHENKCAYLHGHNYRATFYCEAPYGLDKLGRVLDFGAIKERLCEWLEQNWDHRFLIKDDDPWFVVTSPHITSSLVRLPFNPTAENLAQYLGEVIAQQQLEGTGIVCVKVTMEETRKCSAEWQIDRL